MVDVDILSLPAPEKELFFYVRTGLKPSDRPLVIMLHGARRTGASVVGWIERLAEDADVIVFDLPGHGRSEAVLPATLENLSASVLHAIRTIASHRRVFVVGESLGGLIALRLAGEPGPSPICAVVACDPPMSTAKLWQLQADFLPALRKSAAPEGFLSMAWEVFGIGPDRIEERLYYPLVDRLQRPTLIITGDTPLFPSRMSEKTPCVVDELDKFLVRRFYPDAAELREVPEAGHLVLADAPEPCRAIIQQTVARYATA